MSNIKRLLMAALSAMLFLGFSPGAWATLFEGANYDLDRVDIFGDSDPFFGPNLKIWFNNFHVPAEPGTFFNSLDGIIGTNPAMGSLSYLDMFMNPIAGLTMLPDEWFSSPGVFNQQVRSMQQTIVGVEYHGILLHDFFPANEAATFPGDTTLLIPRPDANGMVDPGELVDWGDMTPVPSTEMGASALGFAMLSLTGGLLLRKRRVK